MSKIVGAIGGLALLAALFYVGLTGAFRMGAMDFGAVFGILGILTPVLLGAGLIALIGGLVVMPGGKMKTGLFSMIGGIAALAAGAGPMMMKMQGDKVPAIHDITTDTKYPPEFYAVREIRIAEESPNSTDYDAAVAEKQIEAYPDLTTRTFEKSYEAVFMAAELTLKDMGLEIVGKEENAGRIEATATTAWWGFKDDVVVRVNRFSTPVEVDVRSKSRVGISDLGANAKRIETFFEVLEQKL